MRAQILGTGILDSWLFGRFHSRNRAPSADHASPGHTWPEEKLWPLSSFEMCRNLENIIPAKSALASLPHLLLLQDETKGNFSPAFDRFSPSGPPAVAQPVCEYKAPVSFINRFKTWALFSAYLTYSQKSVCNGNPVFICCCLKYSFERNPFP